jgi:hypothetical protein
VSSKGNKQDVMFSGCNEIIKNLVDTPSGHSAGRRRPCPQELGLVLDLPAISKTSTKCNRRTQRFPGDRSISESNDFRQLVRKIAVVSRGEFLQHNFRGRVHFYRPSGERGKSGTALSALLAYGQNNIEALRNAGIGGALYRKAEMLIGTKASQF